MELSTSVMHPSTTSTAVALARAAATASPLGCALAVALSIAIVNVDLIGFGIQRPRSSESKQWRSYNSSIGYGEYSGGALSISCITGRAVIQNVSIFDSLAMVELSTSVMHPLCKLSHLCSSITPPSMVELWLYMEWINSLYVIEHFGIILREILAGW